MTTATDHIPKLRFSGFNAAWSSREVGDIAKIKHGYAFKGEFFADSGAYVVLTPGNFQLGGGFRYQGDKEKYYSDPDFPKDYILQRGDLVTAMTEQAVGLIGSPLVVPEDGKFLHNQRLGLFQFAEGEKTGFLYFSMQTSSMRREFSNSAAGSKVRHTSPKRIESLPLKIPTLTEQRKIADFLTAMDGRIGQLIQKKALLEDYKKGVMQQLFTQAIRFKDDHGNDFPDWEEKKLGEVLTIGSGRDYKHLGEGDIPVYGSGGLMTYVDSSLYEGESVGIGRKGTIDKPRFLEGAFWTVDTLFYTHSFEAALPRFIYGLFQRINWRAYNEAGGVPSLSKSTIEKIPVLMPHSNEQTKIADFLSAIDRKIESVAAQITETQTFKRGLLQQMFV